MRAVSVAVLAEWLEERLSILEAFFVFRRPESNQGAVKEVQEHLPCGRNQGMPKLKLSNVSMSKDDVPLFLTEEDVGRRFLVRVPWGVSMTGGFVFLVSLERLTESHAIFKALYHVGRMADGSRVYAWEGYTFSVGRGEVYGREVQKEADGPVNAKARVEIQRGTRPALP